MVLELTASTVPRLCVARHRRGFVSTVKLRSAASKTRSLEHGAIPLSTRFRMEESEEHPVRCLPFMADQSLVSGHMTILLIGAYIYIMCGKRV